MTRLNILAADIHKRMAEDRRFGYSWYERYGAVRERWTVDGASFDIMVGDYDCSSSTITAWKLALAAAGVALGAATYTGNMRSVFLATGLFEWKPASFAAEPGDLYLNERNHVAMCQPPGEYGGRYYSDPLSEFSMSETGGISGQRGDQTGRESRIAEYYSYPWDGILHYIGTQEVGGSAKWRHDETGWWYEMPDGSYPKETWKKIDGDWYLFDKKGYACEGWQKDNGKWYYFDPAPSCRMHTRWLYDKAWYWMGGDGAMACSTCKQVDGKWYAFGPDGKMLRAVETDGKGALKL